MKRETKKRRELFIKLYETQTLKQIGDKYGLTGERVRQIINNEPNKIKNEYLEVISSYEKILKSIKTLDNAESEIRRLSRQDRRKKIVIQRRLLVQFLHKQFGLSKLKLAKMFSRDHTSVINLINN